jgi:hypothetical protein
MLIAHLLGPNCTPKRSFDHGAVESRADHTIGRLAPESGAAQA